MKKIYIIVLFGLLIHPGFICADSSSFAQDPQEEMGNEIEDFDDFTEDSFDNVSQWRVIAQEGGQYALAFTVGAVAYMILFATSVTVRNKTMQAIKKMRRTVQRIIPLDDEQEDVVR